MRKISMTTFAMFTALVFASTASAGDDKAKKAPDTKDTKTTTTTTTTTTTAEPAAAAEIPDPAPELLAAAKSMKGTWKCTGTMNDMTGQTLKAKGTVKWALDLDKMWMKGTMALGKLKGQKRAMKMTFYRTFAGGTWSQVGVDNMGGWGSSTSTGPDEAGKATWEGEMHWGGQVIKGRDFEETKTEKKKTSVRLWGEMTMDGKNWVPMYDMTCKK